MPVPVRGATSTTQKYFHPRTPFSEYFGSTSRQAKYLNTRTTHPLLPLTLTTIEHILNKHTEQSYRYLSNIYIYIYTHTLTRSHGRVELYLYPPSGPHRACNGITLPFLYMYVCMYVYAHTYMPVLSVFLHTRRKRNVDKLSC